MQYDDMKTNYITKDAAIELKDEATRLAVGWVDYYKENEGMKDEGTCVSGNGVVVEFLPEGKRKPRRGYIVTNGSIGFQTEQEKFFRDIIKIMSERYPSVKFIYDAGRMV